MSQIWGRAPNAQEKVWIAFIMDYGCYCCVKSGVHGSPCLPHHTDGRTKPDAHLKTIPLCAAHHEYSSPFGIHANLGAWRKIWGREETVLAELRKEFEKRTGQD